MEGPLILTFDVGTQSMRGIIAAPDGSFVDFCQVKYDPAYYSPKPNWAQQDPRYYYRTLCRIAKTLAQRQPAAFRRLAGVTVTAFRDSVVLLDRDKEPLRDLILWLDQRKAAYQGEFGTARSAMFRVVDMYDTAVMQFEMTPANWIRQNEPETWKRTAHYVMLSTYLNYLLTGRLRDCAANQTGHVPIDYQKRRWLSESALNSGIFNIPARMLCELVGPGETIGAISAQAQRDSAIPEGLPLIATGPDKACETLGLSVAGPGKASISLGTAASIDLAGSRYFEPQPFLPSYPGVAPRTYNSEVQIYRGYWMISWFKKEFAQAEIIKAEELGVSPESLLDRELAKVPAGAEGLMLLPYWQPGIEHPNARGAVIGFTDRHTKAHLYRAIIEGVGYGLMRGLASMQRRSKAGPVRELYAGGGGSRSDPVCQITANMFGLPVKRIQTAEASGLGSSLSAFVSLGVYGSYEEAIRNMIRVQDVFEPEPGEHAVYQRLFDEVYQSYYDALAPLNDRIKSITGGKHD